MAGCGLSPIVQQAWLIYMGLTFSPSSIRGMVQAMNRYYSPYKNQNKLIVLKG